MERAIDAVKNMQASIQRLQLHDEVLPAVGILQEVERQAQSIREQEENIRKSETTIRRKEADIEESGRKLTLLKEAAAKAQEQLDSALPLIAEARALKTRMEAARPNLTEKEETLKLAKRERQTAQKETAKNARNIQKWTVETEQANKALQATQAEIEKQKLQLSQATQAAEKTLEAEKEKTTGQSIEQLQTDKSAADRKLQDVQQAVKTVDRLDAATQEKQKNEERIQALGKRNAEIDEAIGKLTIEALEKETRTLRKSYTLMASEQWENHRSNLAEGKPCPLCGSTSHPYHTDNKLFEEAATELSQLMQAKEETLKQQQTQEKKLSGERMRNDGEIHTLQQRQTKLL